MRGTISVQLGLQQATVIGTGLPHSTRHGVQLRLMSVGENVGFRVDEWADVIVLASGFGMKYPFVF